MTRTGIVIAQQGADVSRAPDYQKVLDSKFPLLEISDEVDISVNFNTGTNGYMFKVIHEHNLGFIPAFEWFDKRADAELTPSYEICADTKYVYVRTLEFFTDQAGTAVGRLIIFNHNLQATITPTPSSSESQSQSKSRYGLKNLGDGTNIASKSYRDFSINTEAKAMAIHQAGVVKGISSVEPTIQHNLGYMPTYMVFDLQDKDSITPSTTAKNIAAVPIGFQYGFVTNGSAPPLATYADKNNIRFTGVQSVYIGQLAYIILKDPVVGTV